MRETCNVKSREKSQTQQNIPAVKLVKQYNKDSGTRSKENTLR